ncbi:hypothetical protein Pla22_43380 [Rubripirellula amarantea]|uniref:Uncharacterized protein n=1 Tax=Rubripirellula amarantea TaxID=2527999 RepID=A0A5C5WDW1_9BACT|nr:hypothetical protein Pla22_43380 [Rubripirellula amarantea]
MGGRRSLGYILDITPKMCHDSNSAQKRSAQEISRSRLRGGQKLPVANSQPLRPENDDPTPPLVRIRSARMSRSRLLVMTYVAMPASYIHVLSEQSLTLALREAELRADPIANEGSDDGKIVSDRRS